MKLAMIHTVAVSGKGKPYGTLASGAVVFGRKGLELAKGQWIIYNESLQTQDAEGNELENPIPVNVVASTWATKNDAIAAYAEPQLLDAEVNAFVAKETKRITKEFSLEGAAETA